MFGLINQANAVMFIGAEKPSVISFAAVKVGDVGNRLNGGPQGGVLASVFEHHVDSEFVRLW
jgi:hypothetical protein